MSVYDKNGNRLENPVRKQTLDILVASSTVSDAIKADADYVCTGTGDELVLQTAITRVAENGGGKVRLSAGIFYISSFPQTDSADDHAALIIPQTRNCHVDIVGSLIPFGHSTYDACTTIKVTPDCYNNLDSSQKYTILRAGYMSRGRDSKVSFSMRDAAIYLASNQKKITCLDMFYVNEVILERLRMYGYDPTYNGNGVVDGVPAVAVDGCVGIRGVDGSNSGIQWDLRNMMARGFHTGFDLGGEHLIGINLSSLQNVYGYRFGAYTFTSNTAFLHPMTLINCCDENNINLPLFKSNSGKQAVNLIDFNMEWGVLNVTPGGAIGDHAKETTPGTFCGNVNYTMCYGGVWVNNVTEPFWASDGSGKSIKTKNDAQELFGTSATRRTYAPNYMQEYFDTTANKLLICKDPANKTWVDANGNSVS